MLRHLPWDDPNLAWQKVRSVRRSTLTVELSAVIDCRDPAALGLSTADLCHPTDYRLTPEIGAAALVSGVEALLVPSFTRTGDNLVILTANLRPGSRIAVIETVDPRL